jgi:uncharacterized protein YeaO (DUF488 family)
VIHIARLGSPRLRNEGPRIGTVRRPPRGVPKAEHASRDFYDAWLPELAPSEQLVAKGLSARTDREWAAFVKRYRSELKRPAAARLLDLLAAMSKTTDLSVGCYCENEERCHRSVLRKVLEERGAKTN